MNRLILDVARIHPASPVSKQFLTQCRDQGINRIQLYAGQTELAKMISSIWHDTVDLVLKVGILYQSPNDSTPIPSNAIQLDDMTWNCLTPEHIRSQMDTIQQQFHTDPNKYSILLSNPEDIMVGRINDYRQRKLQRENISTQTRAVSHSARKETDDDQSIESNIRRRARDEMHRRIKDCCEMLEQTNNEMNISSFGIALESFSHVTDDDTSVGISVDSFVEYSKQNHSCSLVQVPTNIVEQNNCSDIAYLRSQFQSNIEHTRHLETIARRPLQSWITPWASDTSVTDVSPLRAVSLVDANRDDFTYRNTLHDVIQHFSPEFGMETSLTEEEKEISEACAWLRNLLLQLDKSRYNYHTLAHYQHDLASRIAPLIRDKIGEIDSDSAVKIASFLDAYGNQIEQQSIQRARNYVESNDNLNCTSDKLTFDQLALDWIFNQQHFDSIVVEATPQASETTKNNSAAHISGGVEWDAALAFCTNERS